MSKINELFKSDKTVFVFDIDGVLVPLAFGDYTHYILDDEAWNIATQKDDLYKNMSAIPPMKEFISKRNLSNIYICSKVFNESEAKQKIKFVKDKYGINPDNVFCVYHNDDKLKILKSIQKKYPDLEEKYFAMVDDSTEVLNHIMFNSKFSTIHISSFMK